MRALQATLEVIAADGRQYTARSSAALPGVWYIDLVTDVDNKRGRLFGRIECNAGQMCFVTKVDNDKEAWPYDCDLAAVDTDERRGKRRG